MRAMRRMAARSGSVVRLLLAAGGVAVALAGPGGARAEPSVEANEPRSLGGQVAFFQDIRVAPDEIRRGDLVCIFGNVDVEGEAARGVVVIGGNLRVTGTVRQDAVAILSGVRLEPGASVGRNLVSILGSVDGSAQVRGDVVNVPLPLVPSGWSAPLGMVGALIAWGALLWTFFTFLLLLLLAMLAPARVRVVSEEAPVSLLWAYLAGIGAYAGMAVLTGVLAITVIGLPLALVAYLAFIVLKWIGLAGIYHRIGSAVAGRRGRELSLLGAILLGFFPFALLQLIPLFLGGGGILLGIAVRLLFWVFVEIPAVGLVLLTRIGSRPRGHAPPAAPPAPAPLVPTELP